MKPMAKSKVVCGDLFPREKKKPKSPHISLVIFSMLPFDYMYLSL